MLAPSKCNEISHAFIVQKIDLIKLILIKHVYLPNLHKIYFMLVIIFQIHKEAN